MKRNKDKSKEVKRIKTEVGEAEEFSGDDKPTVDKECVKTDKRSKRKSTDLKSQQLNLKLLAENQHHFADRPHRSKQEKQIKKNEQLLEDFVDEQELLNQAIKEGKIWSGFRGSKSLMPGIGWSSGFSKDWWDDYATKKFYNKGWICNKQLEGCKVSVLQTTHKGLEIGHKDSFYLHLSKSIDPKFVCDGTVHWQVYLVKDARKQNEVEDNLEPQCHPCNMKQHNEESGGFEPRKLENCSGGCDLLNIKDIPVEDNEEEF